MSKTEPQQAAIKPADPAKFAAALAEHNSTRIVETVRHETTGQAMMCAGCGHEVFVPAADGEIRRKPADVSREIHVLFGQHQADVIAPLI